MNKSVFDLLDSRIEINLKDEIDRIDFPTVGIFKCRILYSASIESIEFIPYSLRSINSIKIVHDDSIDYSYKFEDRSRIDTLFEQRGACDDIIIIKAGKVTDSSYSNVIFFDGKKWVTPNTPLLQGVMRQALLDSDMISGEIIYLQDILAFKKIKLINAMVGIDGPEIDVSHIVF